MLMASTIFDFETNKNAVIIHYPHLYPVGPFSPFERPTGCVVRFHGYNISADVYSHSFHVWGFPLKKTYDFKTLKQAKQFILDKVNDSLVLL